MNEELTPWFPADVRPIRKGDYQIRPPLIGGPRWSYWNGKRWSFFTLEQDRLDGNREIACHPAGIPWRGLASDPKASKP